MTTIPYNYPNGLMQYGVWAGSGYAAGEESPSFVPLTESQKGREGSDAYDTLAAKPHDLAYDAAQKVLITDLAEGLSQREAIARYF
jgi:hypothetical protein